MNTRSEMNSRLLARVEGELWNIRRNQEDLDLRVKALAQSLQEIRSAPPVVPPALASWSTLPERVEEVEQQIKRMDHRLRETSVMVARSLVKPVQTTPLVTKPNQEPQKPSEPSQSAKTAEVSRAATKPVSSEPDELDK